MPDSLLRPDSSSGTGFARDLSRRRVSLRTNGVIHHRHNHRLHPRTESQVQGRGTERSQRYPPARLSLRSLHLCCLQRDCRLPGGLYARAEFAGDGDWIALGGSGSPPDAVYCRRVAQAGSLARARSQQAWQTGCHFPVDLQCDYVGDLHLRGPESHRQPGAARFLRIPGLGHRTKGHSAIVHLPQIPQRCDARRDLEDQLQGASGVDEREISLWSIVRSGRQLEQKSERKLVRMLDDLNHIHRFRVSKKGKSLKRRREEDWLRKSAGKVKDDGSAGIIKHITCLTRPLHEETFR